MIKTLSRAQIEHIHEILYRPNTEGLDDGIEWTKFPSSMSRVFWPATAVTAPCPATAT